MRVCPALLCLLLLPAVPAAAQTPGSGGDAGGLLQKFLKAIEERDGTAAGTAPETATGSGTAPEAGTAAAAGTGAPTLIDATDPQAVLAIASRFGPATLTTDSVGDPMIDGTMDPYTYVVFFYGCKENRDCTTLMFQTRFVGSGETAEEMAEWNRTQRFASAYLDAGGSPTIEMDANLFGGVTEANLDDTFDWWRVVMQTFADKLSE